MQKKSIEEEEKDMRHIKNKMMVDINQTISVTGRMDG